MIRVLYIFVVVSNFSISDDCTIVKILRIKADMDVFYLFARHGQRVAVEGIGDRDGLVARRRNAFSSADMEGWAESRKAQALIGNNIFMVSLPLISRIIFTISMME